MSKRFTKIICAAVAVISAATLAFTPACGIRWSGVSEKDTSAYVEGTNGGFVTETADYVYFINGKAANTDDNTIGSVLKGSVQRIKRTDLNAGNYAKTDTVVPSVIYSGSYNAGLYIYGDYIYYTSPTTEKNTEGEVLNSYLDFKRTKLDGSDLSAEYIWQSTDNAVDYRFVSVGDTVYIIYALSENLYGSSVTNIHSINCSTKENTILAYNVAGYSFDTVDVENPFIFYTMAVPQFMGSSTTMSYNQLYVVRADAKESPREYDFSDIEDYDAETDPVYINLGDYVFDGIGKTNYDSGRVTQFNYAFYNEGKSYELINDDYTYELQWYRNGTLYYTRKSKGNSSLTNMYTLNVTDFDANKDGRVDAGWDAVQANSLQTPLILGADTTTYEFVEMGGELYAINAGASGITKSLVKDGKVEDALTMTDAASATILQIKEENGHTNLYYSATGGNGYTINRIAIDGTEEDYRKLSPLLEPDLTYSSIRVLDLDAVSAWYKPEFISGSNKLFFASETDGVSLYNYIMVCDLEGENGIMTNQEIDALNKKYEALTEKIEEYNDAENADGTQAYVGLANALKYLSYTADVDYIDELIQAYIDVEGRDKEYAYSEASVAIYKDFAAVEGDWADYKDDYKTINGEKVYANSHDYYYAIVGRMTDADSEGLIKHFREEFMKDYPVDDSTWWTNLSAGGQAGFIIGMVFCGMAVIGGATLVTALLIERRKQRVELGGGSYIKVDITDDKDVDVYAEEGAEESAEESADGEGENGKE